MGAEFRTNLVGDYIQLLINSGHKFSYIKSVVLQAVTKFEYMVSRSKLSVTNKRYMPLHRHRNFMKDERKLIKYTTGAIWYTREDHKDKFRNAWKQWIRRKGQKVNKCDKRAKMLPAGDKMILNNSLERRVTRSSLRNDNRITTAVFIPKTPN